MINIDLNPNKIVPKIIYKYATWETAEKILLGQRIMLSNPKNFNDPYEFHNRLFHYKITQKRLNEMAYRKLPFLSRQQRRKKTKGMTDFFLKEMVEQVLLQTSQKYSITCFSGFEDEILMWSHYAQQHKGICIGFSFNYSTMDYEVHPVNYAPDFNPPDFGLEPNKAILYWMTTKYVKWTYENEYRLINQNNAKWMNFEIPQVAQIIFGCQVSKELSQKTKKLFNKKGYHSGLFFRMKMAEDSFKLIKEKI